jgi:4-hydroxy-tetrahydrodipicolinate synthase
MLENGIYPAAVTPLDATGRIDMVSVARLLAWFESSDCKGAVLAGTNGEGPSLSAIEKRDLIRQAMPLRGKLELILGISTPSLDEAIWLCKQAHKDGAAAVLLMAPFYFREAGERAIAAWFEEVLRQSPSPVLAYNFPKRAGITLSAEMLSRLTAHDSFIGAKDSSGDPSNLTSYRQALGDKHLFVGDETLLIDSLAAGWNGSISGAANVIPKWLSQITKEWFEGEEESARTKFQVALPAIERLRRGPQPALNKGLLKRAGVVGTGLPRLPLEPADPAEVEQVVAFLKQHLG